MAEEKRSDQKIVADFRDQLRLSLRLLVAVLAYVAACSFLDGWADRTRWFAHHGIPEGIYGFAMLAPVLLATSLLFRKKQTLKLAELPEHILRREIDACQRGWRVFLLVVLAVLFFAVLGFTSIQTAHAASKAAIAAGIFTGIIAILSALAAILYPGLRIFDDERARALRARSAMAGYVTLIVLTACALPVALLRPSWTAEVLAWSLFTAAAVPILTYVILDWLEDRASHGD